MLSLENEKRDLEVVIDLMPISIIIVDEHLMVIYSNQQFNKMLNRSIAETVNKRPGDCICCANSFLTPNGCGFSEKCNDCKLRKLVKMTLDNNLPSDSTEIEMEIVENHIVKNKWFKINTIPITKNEEKQILIGLQDVTEYKNLNITLIKLKEIAETANRAKSEFLANMSHEIRTPLNGIIGMTELTISTNLTEEQKENLKIVKNCADTLLSLINNILDLSKIEAKKVIIENIEFEMRALIKKVINIHLTKAKEKNINLNYTIDSEVPKVLIGDSHRIEQILNNLLSNAVKFTDNGFVNLKINKINKNNDIFEILFIVEDTGIGIDKDEISSLFKNFSQVDGSITRKYGGTGLGLVISKKLVELMGGNIEVDSQKGKGSKFYFSIKLQETKDVLKEPKINFKNNSYINDLKIILVEDDKVNQIVIKKMLQEIGYKEIVIASNGFEALKKLEICKFDIILMDIQMPELDGMETAQIIRAKDEKLGRHIPIIAITAYALKGDKEKFLSKGMDDYIAKPVDIKKLEETIKRTYENCNKDKDIIQSYLKCDNTENINSSIELDEKDRKYFFEMMSEISIYLKEDSTIANKYDHIERIAHNIKIVSEEKRLNIIKSLAFKIELSARKKNDISIKSNYDKISNLLKYKI